LAVESQAGGVSTPSKKSPEPESIALTAQNAIQTFGLIDDVEEQIRQRAFELYEERDRVNRYFEEDWLEAELEVRSRQAGKAA
jgi:hypothetical protein